MEIIVPLRVHGIAAGGAGIDNANILEIALGDNPSLAIQSLGLPLKGLRQFGEDVVRPIVIDSVNCVQAKRVRVIFGRASKERCR